MSKLDDNLKASKKIVEPRSELADKIMKAVYVLPTHKRNSWRRLPFVWATPVALALLAVIIIASPLAEKLNINRLSLNTATPSTGSKVANSNSNDNGNKTSPNGSSNSNSNNSSNSTSNTATNSTSDNSLNNGLEGVGSSINENQQSLDAASTAINDQQLDTPPSD
jgi:hypothetical protein